MSIAAIVRAIVGGLIAAVATALPFATHGNLNLSQWLSAGLAGLVGTGLTAYSPSASAATSEPAAGPVVAPGVIGEVEKVAEDIAPVLEAAVPAAAPVVAAVEGALNPGASQLP